MMQTNNMAQCIGLTIGVSIVLSSMVPSSERLTYTLNTTCHQVPVKELELPVSWICNDKHKFSKILTYILSPKLSSKTQCIFPLARTIYTPTLTVTARFYHIFHTIIRHAKILKGKFKEKLFYTHFKLKFLVLTQHNGSTVWSFYWL
jgi:hypothetical protein